MESKVSFLTPADRHNRPPPDSPHPGRYSGPIPLRRIATLLPSGLKLEARRLKHALDLATSRFRSSEPEFDLLPELVGEGDWVLDVGAAVGHYSLRLSEIVGSRGRVFAFEPVEENAAILMQILRRRRRENVTVMNVAASDRAQLVGMRIPAAGDGWPNYYSAHLDPESSRFAFSLPLDSIPFPQRVAFVKIDAERHEKAILRGMRRLLERDRPHLLIEGHPGLADDLAPLGYRRDARFPNSPNLLLSAQRPARTRRPGATSSPSPDA